MDCPRALGIARWWGDRGFRRRQGGRELQSGDKATRTHPTRDETIAAQLFVGCEDGNSRQTKFLCQRASRWQARVGRQTPTQDSRLDRAGQLSVVRSVSVKLKKHTDQRLSIASVMAEELAVPCRVKRDGERRPCREF